MKPPTDPSILTRLVAEARAGDERALDALLVQYKPLLISLVAPLRSWLVGSLDGDDLQQQANLIFIELVKEFQTPSAGDFGSYLKDKLKWRLLNYLRRERRKTLRQAILGDDIVETLAEQPRPAIGIAPTSGARMGLDITTAVDINNPRLRAALRRLSPKQKSVIFRLYWQGKSVEEIAAELSVSKQSVTGLRRRAEDRIRETQPQT